MNPAKSAQDDSRPLPSKAKQQSLERKGDRGRSAALSRPPPREILRFQPGHHVEFFDRGRQAIDAMLEEIDRAQDHVHLETYILRTDDTGRRLLSRLEARARDGVAVRIILDAIGSRTIDRRALVGILDAGARVVRWNPPSQWLSNFRPRQRDHRKILIIDAQVGFMGGLNIGDEYVGEDADGPTWRDAHIRIEGPALTELQALFVENWFRSGGESLEWRRLLAPEPEDYGDRSVAILADGPNYRRRRMRSFFLDELARATTHVLLVSPYFAPGPRVLEALEEASDRGVRVELLLAGYSDHPVLRRAVRAFIPRLIDRGVRVFEDPRRMMHAKLAAFDETLAVVGTSNLDRQSLDHSCEVNAMIQGREATKWILDHFGTDVLDVSPIDRALLERRSFATRWIDRAAAILARL